jgi:hypothetical protein
MSAWHSKREQKRQDRINARAALAAAQASLAEATDPNALADAQRAVATALERLRALT